MMSYVEYDCEENDNTIRIYFDDDNTTMIDEIWIGCSWLPEDGWSIIGIEDLRTALGMAGYEINGKT